MNGYLFNVVKHSGVAHAVLTVGPQNGGWRLSVQDSGEGFDSDRLDSGSSGFGLFSIRQRLYAYGGRLHVRSRSGQGCLVEIDVPLEANPTAHTSGEESSHMQQPTLAVPEGPHRIRVLLVDDHDILRTSLAGLLRSESDIEVVGEASDGEAAIQLAQSLNPDVILMDITMPRMNGVEATRRIVQEHPATRVVALSMHTAADLGQSMADAGAVGFVSKSAPIADLLSVIRIPVRSSV